MGQPIYAETHDYWTDYFEREVWVRDKVAVSILNASRHMHMIGRGQVETTPWLVWGNYAAASEVYQTDNLIDYVVSSDAGDTELIEVYGHTIDGNGDFTLVEQDVTLTGQTPVLLTTPLARVHLAHNHGANVILGQISVYRSVGTTVTAGVPQDAAKIHLLIEATFQQSYKAAYTTASTEYLAIKSLIVAITKKTAGNAEFGLEIREQGSVFHGEDVLTASTNSGAVQQDEEPFLIVKPNSDIRVRAIASAGSTPVSLSMHGVHADIIT